MRLSPCEQSGVEGARRDTLAPVVGGQHAIGRVRFNGGVIADPYKNLYIHSMSDSKPVVFRGSGLDDLRVFPDSARREASHQLDQVQRGRDPDDWRAMSTVGPGVWEIRIRDTSGAFRVLYVAKFADAVQMLHCFQKKTQKTSRKDLDLAARRYRELLTETGE